MTFISYLLTLTEVWRSNFQTGEQGINYSTVFEQLVEEHLVKIWRALVKILTSYALREA